MNLPTTDLDTLERYALIHALRQGGGTNGAGRLLGTTRYAVRHKRRKYDLVGAAAIETEAPPELPTLNLEELRRAAVERAAEGARNMEEVARRLGRTRCRTTHYLDKYQIEWSPCPGWTRRPRKAANA